MQPSIPDIMARAAHTLFGRPLVHTDLLPTIIETIVSTAVCPSWRWKVNAAGDPGRFIHNDGTTATVEYFVMIDHRGQFQGGPEFSLGRPIDQALWRFHSDPDLSSSRVIHR